MINSEDVYKIGTLGKIHGVKGEINFTFTDDVFDRVDADYLILSLDEIFVPFFIEEYRFRSNERVLIKFCDVDTTDRAQELVGTEVFFPYSLSDKSMDEIAELCDRDKWYKGEEMIAEGFLDNVITKRV